MTPQSLLMLTNGVGPTETARGSGVCRKTVWKWARGDHVRNDVRHALAVYFKMAPEALPVGPLSEVNIRENAT